MPSLLTGVFARAQTIDPRDVAAWGPACDPVRETAIAGGQHKVIALFMTGNNAPAHYGMYDVQLGTWSEGGVPIGDYPVSNDPSVAYDPQSCDFVLAAVGGPAGHIVVSRYKAEDCETGNGSFSSWDDVDDRLGASFLDKPWIVAGEAAEYYIVYRRDPSGLPPDGYAYRRSTDGGKIWKGGDITVYGQRVLGGFCAQPTVAGAGPLYVAYMHSNTRIRFLSGQDQPGDLVDFSHLMDDQQRPAKPLEVRLKRADVAAYLPGIFRALRTPQLAADPTHPDRLYLVYHDTGTADPTDKDVNIYLQ